MHFCGDYVPNFFPPGEGTRTTAFCIPRTWRFPRKGKQFLDTRWSYLHHSLQKGTRPPTVPALSCPSGYSLSENSQRSCCPSEPVANKLFNPDTCQTDPVMGRHVQTHLSVFFPVNKRPGSGYKKSLRCSPQHFHPQLPPSTTNHDDIAFHSRYSL